MPENKPLHLLIVDGSPEPSSPALVAGLAGECDLTIAVDRGADTCRAAGVVPAAFVGDGDTISDAARAWLREQEVAEHNLPEEKDVTDLAYALQVAGELAADRGAESWMPVVTCCSGGRLDHQLGVLGVLARVPMLKPMIVEDGFEAFILSPDGRERWDIGEIGRGKKFSLIPLEASVVSEENMYWELDREDLPALGDRGISNMVTTGFASVTCHDGCVLAMLMWS